MKKIFLIGMFLFGSMCFSQTDEQDSKELVQEMTHAQQMWGRKFQAGLGYTYFHTGHHGLQINYGMWDLNRMGIQAEIFYPLNYVNDNRIFLVTFYWITWDWAPIEQLSIIPKIGYGPKIYEKRREGFYLSWEPTMSLDLSYNINSFVKLYGSYTWAMFKDHLDEINHLHGVSAGVRIAY